jgi:polyisoprenoid-binding protein YceI
MTRFVFAAATAAAFALCAPLAAQAADSNPGAVQAGAYAVEPLHTRVLFSVNHFGFNDYFGEFTGVAGTLKLDPKAVSASQIDVTVPVQSITTTNAKLDDELRSADWFNAAQFPTMRFVSFQITPTGPKTARISGNLTLHGVTKPVVLEATFVGAGPNPFTKTFTTGFSARGHIKRSDFGVSKYVPVVGDDVDLILSAAFEKQPN